MNLIILKTPLQNNKIPLFDLHCDTLLELYNTKQNINDNSLHISLNKAPAFSPYMQISAIWSEYSLSNELAFDKYIKVKSYIEKQNINFATKFSDLKENSFILAVEDARLLNGQISRLDILYQDGVRFLTLNWKDESIIGGAWNTNKGLTPFGKDTVKKCLDLGITVDISHSSERTSYEAIELSLAKNKPLIASHSNSYTVCKHKRNLTDELFNEFVKMRSLVGISLSCEHLTISGMASISTILKHIYHYLSLSGESVVALGCDFDGVSSLPYEILSIKDIRALYFEIEKEFGTIIAKKIFFDNAYSFMQRNFN